MHHLIGHCRMILAVRQILPSSMCDMNRLRARQRPLRKQTHEQQHRNAPQTLHCIASLFLGLVVLVSCGGSVSSSTSIVKRFSSIQQYEVGYNAQGHWTIEFCSDGNFTWVYSDKVEGGTYQYDPATGAIQGMLAGREPLNGQYDPETEVLVWQTKRYRPIPEPLNPFNRVSFCPS